MPHHCSYRICRETSLLGSSQNISPRTLEERYLDQKAGREYTHELDYLRKDVYVSFQQIVAAPG